MRDRLIEFIYCAMRDYDNYVDEQYEIGMPAYEDFESWLADDLIANGVILPPFKIGDRVWYITGIHRTIIKSAIVDEIIINCNGVSDLFVTSDTGSFENSVDIFYRTKEDAEKALAEKENNNAE